MADSNAIRQLAAPIAAASGLEVWDVEVGPGMVRVLLDRPAPSAGAPSAGAPSAGAPSAGAPSAPDTPGTQGVDLDALSAVSRTLSAALDGHDEAAPAGRYHLEVSSPGLERRLRTPAHYRRYQATTVNVKLRAGAEAAAGGSRRLNGILAAAGDTAVSLAVADPAGGQRLLQIPYEQIERTRTVLEWGPAPKLARPPRPATGRRRPQRLTPAAPNAKDAS